MAWGGNLKPNGPADVGGIPPSCTVERTCVCVCARHGTSSSSSFPFLVLRPVGWTRRGERKKVDEEGPRNRLQVNREKKRKEEVYVTKASTHTHDLPVAFLQYRRTWGRVVEKQPSFPFGSTVDDDLLVKTVLSLFLFQSQFVFCGFYSPLLTVHHQVE